MTRRHDILSDARGSAAIEFVVAVPFLAWLVWALFQIGMLFEANAGVQQALGEGARYATTFVPTTGLPPTTTQVQAKITAAKFGLTRGVWDTPNIDTSHATAANGGYWDIQVTYHVTPDWLFFTGSQITIQKTKRVYLSV